MGAGRPGANLGDYPSKAGSLMPFAAKEVILSDEAEAATAALRTRTSKIAGQILRRVEYLCGKILQDVHAGELIPVPLPPAARPLVVRHGPIDKLRCADLPDGWRLLYSFYHVDQERFVVVLEIVDHAQYSQWFPGRRKFGGTRA